MKALKTTLAINGVVFLARAATNLFKPTSWYVDADSAAKCDRHGPCRRNRICGDRGDPDRHVACLGSAGGESGFWGVLALCGRDGGQGAHPRLGPNGRVSSDAICLRRRECRGGSALRGSARPGPRRSQLSRALGTHSRVGLLSSHFPWNRSSCEAARPPLCGPRRWASACPRSAMAGVDDAEPIAVRIGKHDEVWVRGVQIPVTRVAPRPTRRRISSSCSAASSTTRSRWTPGCSWGGVSARCSATRVPSPEGGMRIVKPLSESVKSTDSYPRARDQNDTARSTSPTPSTTVPRRITT